MGDGVRRGAFICCVGLPFGDAPSEGVVDVGPVMRCVVADIVDAHGTQLVLCIPCHVQLSVTAAAFAEAVAPGAIAVAVFLADAQAVAFVGGPVGEGINWWRRDPPPCIWLYG